MTSLLLKPNDSSSLDWKVEDPAPRQSWASGYFFGETKPRRIDVQARELSQWVSPVVQRLTELVQVPAKDPRGGLPMNVDDLLEALGFLGRVMKPDTIAPWIGLLSSGGLELNWRRGDVEVEAVVDSTRDDRHIFVVVGANEWEASFDEADSLFGSVVDRLSA